MKRKANLKSGIRKPRTLALTIALSLAVVAYVFGVFLPGQRETARLREQMRDKRLAIMQADRLLYPIYHAESELAAASEYLEKSLQAAPGDSEITPLFAEIHRRAVEAGAEVVRFEPRRPSPLETISLHPVAMSLEGTFAALWSFLHQVESMPAPLWISDLKIAPRREDEEKLHLEVVLTVFSNKAGFSH